MVMGCSAHVASFPGLHTRHLRYKIHPELLRSILSHDAIRHNHSNGINVIHVNDLAPCLVLKGTLRDHSDDLCVNVPKCHGSKKKAHVHIFS